MEQQLQAISKWGKLVGWIMIIAGGISALSGLFFFLIGAVPGVIQIFLGVFVLRTGENAQLLLQQYSDHALAEMTENYAKFLKLNGILVIVALVFVVLLLIPIFLLFGALF